MKKLDLSAIAPGIAMYVKGGTLSFLQLAYQEALNELTTSRIGSSYDATKGYILNGCLNTGSGSNYIISAGSIFFNGEIYLVPAATFTITGSNVAEGAITTTQYVTDADPTDFTDGNQRNVHNIRKIVFQPGLSGSGAFDFTNAVNLAYKPVGAIGQTIEWLMPGAGPQNALLATYFDPTSKQGVHPLTLGWIIDDGGVVAIGYKAADATAANIGDTGGEDEHVLTLDELCDPEVNLPSRTSGTTPGVNAIALVNDKNTDDILKSNAGIDPTSGGGSGVAGPHNNLQRYKIKLKITRYA